MRKTKNSPPSIKSSRSELIVDHKKTKRFIGMFDSPLQPGLILSLIYYASLIMVINNILTPQNELSDSPTKNSGLLLLARAHVVLTRDDQGQSLVMTGDDSKKDDGDRLVISGNNMGGGSGGGYSSNMIMQDAANREGDIVMNGRSMIIPGEDGHIVLADSRRNDDDSRPPQPPPNLFMYWTPYMSNRMFYRMMPYFG